MPGIKIQQRWEEEENIVYQAIQDLAEKKHFSPSLNDIAKITGFSNSKCFRTKDRLIEKGFLEEIEKGKYRIVSGEKEELSFQILVIGKISAHGEVLFAAADALPVRIPYLSVRHHFALQVEGDEMTAVGILPNDFLIFQEDAETQENDFVLVQQGNRFFCMKYALHEGQEWLKSFVSHEEGCAFSKNMEIKGVFRALYRDWKGDLLRYSLEKAEKAKREPPQEPEAETTEITFALSNALWEAVRPLIPQKEKAKETRPPTRGKPPLQPRKIVEGFFYLLKSQCVWSELPKTYNGGTFFAKWKVWQKDGFFERLWAKDWSSYHEMEGITWEYQSVGGEQKPVTRPLDFVMESAGKRQRIS